MLFNTLKEMANKSANAAREAYQQNKEKLEEQGVKMSKLKVNKKITADHVGETLFDIVTSPFTNPIETIAAHAAVNHLDIEESEKAIDEADKKLNDKKTVGEVDDALNACVGHIESGAEALLAAADEATTIHKDDSKGAKALKFLLGSF